MVAACVPLGIQACRAGRVTDGGPDSRPETVYVGTYTDGRSRGIYRFELDPASGRTTAPVLAAVTDNPSFLALRPDGRVLYAVNEVGSFGGAPTGAVSAFAIDPATGGLALLDRQPSGGAGPCHLVIDQAGRNALVANYDAGTVADLPLEGDGRLRPPAVVRHHAGSGPSSARQDGPHAHQIILDLAGRFAFGADLGADRIFIYRFDPATGGLEPNDPAAVSLPPGSGPRHLAWHPSGSYLYVIAELRSTVTVLRYDAGRGALESLQTISTLPPGYSGANLAAEIAISPDGRFAYASNRGDDSLALFAIDGESGRLTALGRVPSGGRTPRHFAIDPTGGRLLVANQDSDAITVFRLDRTTGRPSPEGTPIRVSRPVCVLFAPPPRRKGEVTLPRTERPP